MAGPNASCRTGYVGFMTPEAAVVSTLPD
jgi:hypothetical protein